MKVFHVCNGHRVDDGRVFYRACCELAKAGYEVHLCAVGTRTEVYREQGVIIHPLPECRSRRERFARAYSVARMATDLKPDLLHVHEPDLLSFVIARAGTRPVIYDVHESYLDILHESHWVPRYAKPLARLAWDQWERRLVRRCAGVIAVTEPIARRYALFHNKVFVVANYPDWQSIEEMPPVKRDGITCVVAGAITPDRGLSQIFRAMASLRKRGVVVQLALAGPSLSGQYLDSLWDEAQRQGIRGQIQYHGVLSKHEALMLQHKASIGLITYLPFQYSVTGLPNKLLECMGMGLPVVCSDFPIYREVAGATGAGILVDPMKHEQIADAIEALVRNPALARQMGEAGRQAVREKFNWHAERMKLLHLYRELIGTPARQQAHTRAPKPLHPLKNGDDTARFAVVPITEGAMVEAVAKIHLQAFAGFLNVYLGRPYIRRFLRWFIRADHAIAMAAVDSHQEIIGYVIGAPFGYNRALNRYLLGVALSRIAMRPSLLFDARLWDKARARIPSLLGRPQGQHIGAVLPKPTMSLVAIGVTPSDQRRGVGLRLIQTFSARAAELGMRSVLLSVDPTNTRARSFYESCGWRPVIGAMEREDELKYFRLVDQEAEKDGAGISGSETIKGMQCAF